MKTKNIILNLVELADKAYLDRAKTCFLDYYVDPNMDWKSESLLSKNKQLISQYKYGGICVIETNDKQLQFKLKDNFTNKIYETEEVN